MNNMTKENRKHFINRIDTYLLYTYHLYTSKNKVFVEHQFDWATDFHVSSYFLIWHQLNLHSTIRNLNHNLDHIQTWRKHGNIQCCSLIFIDWEIKTEKKKTMADFGFLNPSTTYFWHKSVVKMKSHTNICHSAMQKKLLWSLNCNMN